VNEVAYVARRLKHIAMENGIPVIALAQLNRKDADKEDVEPHISHLKESGEIEQSANKVILLHQHAATSEAHRKRAPKSGVVCCTAIAAKQRNGKMGRVDLDFHAYRVTFESADEWGTGN
jgi:replicative DNA helicase